MRISAVTGPSRGGKPTCRFQLRASGTSRCKARPHHHGDAAPAAPDALVRWGFMDAIFERTGRIGAAEYLSVPIATKMAADHPELWQQFQTKLTDDKTFAADPKARLEWWIGQSNYQPNAVNKYPIAEVWAKSC